jgi:hypothetical protein
MEAASFLAFFTKLEMFDFSKNLATPNPPAKPTINNMISVIVWFY